MWFMIGEIPSGRNKVLRALGCATNQGLTRIAMRLALIATADANAQAQSSGEYGRVIANARKLLIAVLQRSTTPRGSRAAEPSTSTDIVVRRGGTAAVDNSSSRSVRDFNGIELEAELEAEHVVAAAEAEDVVSKAEDAEATAKHEANSVLNGRQAEEIARILETSQQPVKTAPWNVL